MAEQNDDYVDVVVHQDNYVSGNCSFIWHPDGGDDGAIGLATCRWVRDGDCQRHDVWYDTSWTSRPLSDGPRDALACQEIGHTLGLTHRPADCMRQKIDPGGIQITYYDDHSVRLINTNY
jgi:hypothetical protein